jgi:hypothetical protein
LAWKNHCSCDKRDRTIEKKIEESQERKLESTRKRFAKTSHKEKINIKIITSGTQKFSPTEIEPLEKDLEHKEMKLRRRNT